MKKSTRRWKNLRYWLFFGYLEWMHDRILYRCTHLLHPERIPHDGQATVIVANHQNALGDPLALEFAFRSRVVNIFARGDIFANKVVGAFLRSLYILPAYRMRTDGYEQLGRNYESFDEAHQRLLGGETVAIFPEGTNQDRHYLGDFSQGYLRMAFGAAEKSGFEKEIFILPTAIHYSNYFHMQADVLVSCGIPVSLKPYYELYKTKPRTAQREVNHLVREQVDSLMLNITDLEHYDAIDAIRDTYGVHYARSLGLKPRSLPQKLEADKRLVAALDLLRASDIETSDSIYADAINLKNTMEHYKVRDWCIDVRYPWLWRLLVGLGLLLLSPIFLFALIPNVIAFYAPRKLVDKLAAQGPKFKMFASGIQFILNSIIVLPICYTAVFLIDLFSFNWIIALVHLLALPWLGIFAWHYRLAWIKWRGLGRYLKAFKHTDMRNAVEKRRDLWRRLDNIL